MNCSIDSCAGTPEVRLMQDYSASFFVAFPSGNGVFFPWYPWFQHNDNKIHENKTSLPPSSSDQGSIPEPGERWIRNQSFKTRRKNTPISQSCRVRAFGNQCRVPSSHICVKDQLLQHESSLGKLPALYSESHGNIRWCRLEDSKTNWRIRMYLLSTIPAMLVFWGCAKLPVVELDVEARTTVKCSPTRLHQQSDQGYLWLCKDQVTSCLS